MRQSKQVNLLTNDFSLPLGRFVTKVLLPASPYFVGLHKTTLYVKYVVGYKIQNNIIGKHACSFDVEFVIYQKNC